MRHDLVKAAGAALLLSGLLPGCVQLLPSAGDLPPRLTLDAGNGTPATGRPIDATLSIADPRGEAVFNTTNVAVLTSPYQFEYLADAEWTGRAPLVLGTYIERLFENEGRLAAVGDPVSLPVADYVLQTDIRALHIDRTGGAALARVAYSARLLDRRGRPVGTRIFSAQAPFSGGGHEAAIAALNEAARQTGSATVDWATGLIAQNEENKALSG